MIVLYVFILYVILDFSDNFEAAFFGNGWTTLAGPQADVVLSTSNVISDTVSLVHTGGDLTGWVNPTTEGAMYGLSCHGPYIKFSNLY